MTPEPSSAPATTRPTPDETGEFARTGLGRDRVPLRLLLVLALLNAAAPLSTDMYLSAFPTMARDLTTGAPSIQLTLTAFMLGIGTGQLVIGTLSDRWGRRTPLLVSLSVFALVGALCAVAPSVPVLIALRFVQGFTGSAGMVIGRAVVADSVRGRAAVRAYSLLSMVGALAPVVAPVLGAALLPLIGWRGVFAVLGVVGLVLLATSFVGVEETLPWHRRSTGGARETARVVRGLLANRTFVAYTGATVLAFGVLFSYVSASPFVVQGVLGLSPQAYALDFAVNSSALIVWAALNARLVRRFPPQRLLAAGYAGLTGAAVTLLVAGLAGTTSRAVVLPLLFLVMSSAAMVMANGVGLAMNAVGSGKGTASAVIGSSQFGLGALVSPLVGLGGEGTFVPMALTMGVCVLLGSGCLSVAAFSRDRSAPAPRP